MVDGKPLALHPVKAWLEAIPGLLISGNLNG
jgi:hypothetical protein